MIRYLGIFLLISFISSIHCLAEKTLPYYDSHIAYYGRWQPINNNSSIQSISPGAYLKVMVHGPRIILKLSRPTTVYCQIDDQKDSLQLLNAVYHGILPIELVVPIPDDNELHTISVISMDNIHNIISLESLVLFAGDNHLQSSDDATHYIQHPLIEFVGHDSTLGLGTSQSIMTSFPWLVSNILGTERSQIAFPGAWLMDHKEAVGMETQYFLGLNDITIPPKIVVVLLGEFDQYTDKYTESLAHFLLHIRSQFPQAIVLVLSEPLGVLFRESQSAVNYINDEKSDQDIYFVDTTCWVQYGSTSYSDPSHLNDIGQDKFARLLAPFLQAKLSSQPFPDQKPNPNLPSAWQTMDVGDETSRGLIGSVSFDSAKIFTLWGSGIGTIRQKDAFRFVFQPLSLHGSIEVTVESHSAFASCAKAGIMMREHLAHGSPNVMLGFSPADGIFLQHRPHNFNMTQLVLKRRLSPPYRLRLERIGTTKFVTKIAPPRSNGWEIFSVIENASMARDIYVGLVVTSCDPSVVSVAKFSDVSLQGGIGSGGFHYQSSPHTPLLIQQ
ncbi:hypothetical protein BDB01DRAFT_778202 [Pilobolus umbonatus]|nr:hypothetical protein BDB01DRAFT_778202 [Pilobolus umbonatus]